MTTPQLLWPPPTVELKEHEGNKEKERVDLLGLIPPNRYDDFSLPNREQQVAGVTLRADRVIMDRERYPDCDRSTQHKLSDDIQASCREQGYCISVKEWADKNQHRGTLRLRLRCRSSACRFQFQLNWDSKVGFWYISRRRCGTFIHTCKPTAGGASTSPTQEGNKRKLSEGKGSGSKRARFNAEGGANGTANTNSSSSGALSSTSGRENGKSTNGGSLIAPSSENPTENSTIALEQALDSARSLLDLSRAPSSPVSVSHAENEEEDAKSTPPLAPAQAPLSQVSSSFLPMRIGDRVFLHNISGAPIRSNSQVALISSSSPNSLTAQQKLALLRGQDLGGSLSLPINDPIWDRIELRGNTGINGLSPSTIKAAMQQRCLNYPAQGQSAQQLLQVDPRLLHTGLLMNGVNL